HHRLPTDRLREQPSVDTGTSARVRPALQIPQWRWATDFSMGAVGGTVSNKSSGWPDEIMSCGTGCLPGGPMMDPKNPGAEPASDSPLVPWFLATRGRLFGTLFLVLALPMGGLGFLAAEQ